MIHEWFGMIQERLGMVRNWLGMIPERFEMIQDWFWVIQMSAAFLKSPHPVS